MRKKLLNLCLTALLSVVSTAAWALTEEGGFYQIGSAEDYAEFAALVNSGQKSINAILTADIDLGTDIDTYKLYDGEYNGVFDGAGHTITIDFADCSKDDQGPALFRSIGRFAIVKRLKVQGSLTTERQHAAAITNYSGGVIRDCWVDVNITVTKEGGMADGSAAALIGQCNMHSVTENNLAKVTIDAPDSHKFGGVAAWSDAQRTHFANNLCLNEGNFVISGDESAGLVRKDANLASIDLPTYNADSYHNRPQSAVANNYVLDNWGTENKGTEVVTSADVASGKVCYMLNSDQSDIRWTQNIGTDPYPVPAVFRPSGQVYASAATNCQGKATGEVTYSNSGSVMATPHTYDKYGVCTTCGEFNWNYFDLNDPTKFDLSKRAFVINDGNDFFVIETWNRFHNGLKFNMELANDVECKPTSGQLIFNSTGWIESSFYGQNHTLTIEMANITEEHAALFPKMYSINNGGLVVENLTLKGNITTSANGVAGLTSILYGSAAKIQNVVFQDSITTSAGGYSNGGVGGIINEVRAANTEIKNVVLHGQIKASGTHVGTVFSRVHANDVKVTNLFSDIDINVTTEGDGSHGGFMFCGANNTTFENCIYAGDLNGVEGSTTNCAGFCGWANGSNYFNNCAFLGTINNISGCPTLSRNVGRANFKNVYSVNTYGSDDLGRFTQVAPETVESGELAYLLNDKQAGFDRFYQLIGTDPEPMPIAKEGALVYPVPERYNCDGQPINITGYANTPSTAPIPDHVFTAGICINCGFLEEGYVMTPAEDGFYEIATPEQFLWWNNYAAKVDLSASARLIADIDMSAFNETYEGPDGTEKIRTKLFVQLGNETTPFYGNFDGQFHTISNLHIYLPGCRGAGLIGVMNSLPSKGFGGISDADARAAEGVFVKNVVLEGGSIYGQGYTGVVGMAANYAGHITMSGILNHGDATVDGGTNASGMLGCAMGSNCHMTINNCGFVGNIHVFRNTQTENGLFSGWLGNYAEVTNCFALGYIDAYPDPHRSWARHPAGASITIKNCYGLEGEGLKEFNDDAETKPEDVTYIPEEETLNGVLTWKANGEQFRNPAWFQTVGVDNNPTPIPTHGVMIYGAEEYFCAASDEDIPSIASTIQHYEDNLVEEDALATQALLDAWQAAVDALTDSTTIASFTEAFYTIEDIKAEVEENKAIYQAYISKCTEILTTLANDNSFSGSLRDALEYYLNEGAAQGEPTADNPLGLYAYIIQEHTATAEEIQAEIARLEQWLTDAIAEDYKPGTDISKLIPNADFSQQKENWTDAWCTSFGEVAASTNTGGTIVGVEALSATGDMYQTVEGMKPGYYLVGVNGAFCPSNNRYSKNYAAGFYANDIFNYFPTIIEDYVAVADTIDQVNCNLHGEGSLDVIITDDEVAYETLEAAEEAGAEVLGFVVHGPYGMAAAANSGRYQAYTLAKVGEDGKLTIGFKSLGTKYGDDWTGWGPLKVVYYGDDDDHVALDSVLSNMIARAQTIIAYEYDPEGDYPYASQPYFPVALKDSLTNAIAAVESAETVEAKAELVETFSRIFQLVYEGKQAYIALYNLASELEIFEIGNLPLVERNAEGKWDETDEMVFGDELYDAIDAMYDACNNGTFSTEEALNPAKAFGEEMAAAIAAIVPDQDEEGYYLISTPQQFVAFRALVNKVSNSLNGKLVNDVDMAGIGMSPIRFNDVYSGTFDGQEHALENVTITHYGEMHTALFFELKNATVKNLKLTGEYYSDSQRMGGLAAWTSGTTTIDNCEIAVALYTEKEGDGTHGGVMGVHGRGGNCTISNCIVACKFLGKSTFSVGGVCGWRDATLRVKNTLILSEYDLAPEPTSYASSIVSRNGYTDEGNVFYAAHADREGAIKQATLATDEQLASGEITYKLNGSQSETPVWFQTLGTDATPRLFDGKTVYFRNGEYTNIVPVEGDVNGDGKVDVADVQFILIDIADAKQSPVCDVNGDGKVDVADVQQVLIMIADQ